MDQVPAKLSLYKYHLIIPIAASLILTFFFIASPRFMTILSYFWPLFLSTTVLLVAMLVIGRTFPSAAEFYGEEEGEGLLDFVAGPLKNF